MKQDKTNKQILYIWKEYTRSSVGAQTNKQTNRKRRPETLGYKYAESSISMSQFLSSLLADKFTQK